MKSKMYVRFLLLVLACGFGPLGAAMAQTQVVRLLCAGGECAGLTFNLSGEGSVYVDWGDGNVVDYHGDQFIIELKIWRGNAYREQGIEQLCDYLESMHTKKGYLLTFDFTDGKQPNHRVTYAGDKTILETVV